MNIGNMSTLNSVVSMLNARAQAKVNMEMHATRQTTASLLKTIPPPQEGQDAAQISSALPKSPTFEEEYSLFLEITGFAPDEVPRTEKEFRAFVEAYNAKELARIREEERWYSSQPWKGLERPKVEIANPDPVNPVDRNHQLVGGMIDAIETTYKFVQLMERYEQMLTDSSFDEGMREAFGNSLSYYASSAMRGIESGIMSVFFDKNPTPYDALPDRTPQEQKIYDQLYNIANELRRLDVRNSSSSDFSSVMDSALERLYEINRTIDPGGRVVRGDLIDPMTGRLSTYELERFDWMNQDVIQGPVKYDFDSPEGQAFRQRMAESGIDFSLENFSSPEVRAFLQQNAWGTGRASVESTWREFNPDLPPSGRSEFDWLFERLGSDDGKSDRVRVDEWWGEPYPIRDLDTRA